MTGLLSRSVAARFRWWQGKTVMPATTMSQTDPAHNTRQVRWWLSTNNQSTWTHSGRNR